nr:MAG: replication-associated protein [Cressdnaviricota sp.]
MPSFYNGKRFFLTYPQCPESKESLLEFLQGKAPVRSFVIATELHKDQGSHLHACVEFIDVQRRSVDWLDFKGKHPNKQDPRKWAACQQYTKKDGDYIESEQRQELEGSLEEIVALASSESCWMQYCVDNKITFQYARWYWDRYADQDISITSNEHVGVICESLKSLIFDDSSRKALVLRGPSGCGKTTWAKINAPKPALFVSHIDQLKKFLTGFHKCIIFDDVSFNHFPRTAQIHLLDFDNSRAIHCRHATATIPSGIHKIFTCNEWPVTRGDPAIERRMRCFQINL